MVTSCLRPAAANSLPVLTGKKTADLQRKRAVIALASRTKEPNHSLHDKLHPWLTEKNEIILNQFVPAALKLLRDLPDQSATANLTTNGEANIKKIYFSSSKSIKNDAYSRPFCLKLDRLRTGVGFFRATMLKWEMASRPTPICECGVIRSNRLTTSKHLLPYTQSS